MSGKSRAVARARCGATPGSRPSPVSPLFTDTSGYRGQLSIPDPTPATTCVWGREWKAGDSGELLKQRRTGAGVCPVNLREWNGWGGRGND